MTVSWRDSLPESYSKLNNKNGDEYYIHAMSTISDHVEIGAFTYIHGNTRITADKLITIGKFCSIASGVRIQVGDEHDYKRVSTFPFKTVFGLNTTYEEAFGDSVHIGNDVWIGESARILSGTIIGDGAVIGAGSVIKGTIKPYGIYVGNPAKLIKMRFEEPVIKFLEEIKWWNWPLEKILRNEDFFSGDLKEMANDILKIKSMIK